MLMISATQPWLHNARHGILAQSCYCENSLKSAPQSGLALRLGAPGGAEAGPNALLEGLA